MPKFSKTSIGLDIGSRFVKFVELTKTPGGVMLSRFGIKEIPQDVKLDRDKLIYTSISSLLSEKNIRARYINISTPAQSVFIRFLKLLQIKEEKLQKTMRFEAQNQIPFPLEEVLWDWSLLDRHKKEGKRAVLVAIKKNLAEDLISRLKGINLDTRLIDVSPLALYNCASFNEDYDETKLGALLDIGAKTTNLVICDRGGIWIRSFPIAGERVEEAREQGIEELVSEIERSLEYYFMQIGETEKRRSLEELIITGGGSLTRNLEEVLTNRFSVKARVLDPFRKLRIEKSIFNDIQKEGVKNELSLAVGLALRGICGLKIEVNFLKDMLRERSILKEKRVYVSLSIALAIFILLGGSMFMRKDYSLKRSKLDKIDEVISLYQTYEPKIKKIQDEKAILEERIDILYNISSSRAVWLDVFKIISGILPKELWITEVSSVISLEKSQLGRLDLGGKALSYQAVNNFVTDLKAQPIFKDVKPISSSIEKEEETGGEIVKFSITMDVVIVGG